MRGSKLYDKNSKCLISISLGIFLFSGICTPKVVQAKEYKLEAEVSDKAKKELTVNNIQFTQTSPEIIEKMKDHSLNTRDINTKGIDTIVAQSSIAISDVTAKALDLAGFKHSAYFLNYAMLPLREEPLMFGEFDTISQDIWNYSNDFEAAVKGFLFNAHGKNEYFATTTMSFKMPSNSKAQILVNTTLKKRTDLFGALHAVTINFGYVKDSSTQLLVLIEDTYDFKREQYDSLTNLVNNMAYYDQLQGKINPYDIEIYADYMHSGLPYGITPW